jgi:ketosteroid isomerase-like protein
MNVTTVDQWVAEFFRAVDAMDASTCAKAFADDGSFRFGNSDPVVGREAIEQSMAGWFFRLGGLSHEITGVWSGSWEEGEVKSVETMVTFTRKDGTQTQRIPATSTLRMERDRIKDCSIFADVSPVFAQ